MRTGPGGPDDDENDGTEVSHKICMADEFDMIGEADLVDII